ncbi:MAG: glycosyltransferase [Nocardioides sp.]
MVGTDHHPFDRLVAWADHRAAGHPRDDVFIQYGSTGVPTHASGDALLTPQDMAARIGGSDIVITHGGPGTIMDVKKAGHRPIVLARDPAYGEHVDEHQMRFAEWCQRRDLIRLIAEPGELSGWIDRLGSTGTREAPEDSVEVAAAVRRFGGLVAAPGPPRGRRPTALHAPVVVAVLAADAERRRELGTRLARIGGAVWLGDLPRLAESGAESLVCECGRTAASCPAWSELLTASKAGGTMLPDPAADPAVDPAADPATAWPGARRRRPGRERRTRLLSRSTVVRRLVEAAIDRTGTGAAVVGSGVTSALGLSHDRHLDLRVVHVSGRGFRLDRADLLALRYRRVPTVSCDSESGPEPVWASIAPGIEPGIEPGAEPHDAAGPSPASDHGRHPDASLPHPFSGPH